MPLLEYRCAACERMAEFLFLAGDRPAPPVCPQCGSREMSRLLSTFSAHSGHGGEKDVDAMCGGGPCAQPGICDPSDCGLDEN